MSELLAAGPSIAGCAGAYSSALNEISRKLSPVEQLYALRDRQKKELEDIEAAIAALEKAPEVANALHLIGRALRY
jgi:hypothetical protein